MIMLDQPEYKRIEFIAQNGADYISFSQGALRLGGVPQAIKDYARTILTTDAADYYTHVLGIRPLREKLAEKLSQRHSTQLSIDNIMVTHGSINGISALCLALLAADDEVLLPEPTYPAYFNIIKVAKAKPVFVSAFVQDTKNGISRWKCALEKIKQATTNRTKMIIIPNPSNPCGVCLTHDELRELKHWCEQQGIYLILDEVYDNYVFEGSFFSGTSLVPESDLIFRTGSFSKDFAMSGWRIGFVVAPAAVLHTMMALQDGLICCPSGIGQYAALHALDNRQLMQPQIEQIYQNRLLAMTLLQPLVDKGIFSYAKPDAGFFLFLKTLESDTTSLVADILTRAKVALVPGKDFGPSGSSYIRLCYARRPELIIEGIKRLEAYFENFTAS